MLLLVSVSNADEARLAVAGGADIVDAKDPAAGALGGVTADQLAAIRATVPQRVPVTAAFGDVASSAEVEAALRRIRVPLSLIKIGFAGARSVDLEVLLARASGVARELPGSPGTVAVAYADHDRVAAPSPEQVIAAAMVARVAGALVDTAKKDGRGLFSYLNSTLLRQWAERLTSQGMFLAIAGSLTVEDLGLVLDTGASIAGVRGAACVGGRNGCISGEQVRRLRTQLAASTREAADISSMMSPSWSTSLAATQRHHIPRASASEK